jgi:hypothetical protein
MTVGRGRVRPSSTRAGQQFSFLFAELGDWLTTSSSNCFSVGPGARTRGSQAGRRSHCSLCRWDAARHHSCSRHRGGLQRRVCRRLLPPSRCGWSPRLRKARRPPVCGVYPRPTVRMMVLCVERKLKTSSILASRHSRFSPRGSDVGKRVSSPYNGKEGPRSPHPPRGPLSTSAHRCAAPLDVAVASSPVTSGNRTRQR